MTYFRILFVCTIYIYIRVADSDLVIDVPGSQCVSTIDLTRHQQVYLNYEGRGLGPGGCTYTITNSDASKEMCIKKNPHKTSMNCMLIFSYGIGRRTSVYSSYEGKSCIDFMLRPLCTKEYKVFASFQDSFLTSLNGFSLIKAHVIVYLQSPPPTTTRRTYTSHTTGSSNSTLPVAIGITSVVMLCVCCVCCCRLGKDKKKPGPNRGLNSTAVSQPSLQTGGITQQNESQEIPSNYNSDPPAYHTVAPGQDQSYYGIGTGRISDQSPFTITTGTQQRHSMDMQNYTAPHVSAPSLDEIDPPPSYESLEIAHL